ncbi:magnesium transporter [Fundicoccus sp. Sow4_D5]|uniref:magnesium transporter n=1 Tax=Fundicoccus sp. Sow4_D5 TaxID=3438782 RepID=UPI003F93F60E
MMNYEAIFKAAKHNERQTFRELFFRLHVKDQMDLFHALYPKNKRKIENFLSPSEFAKLFEWMTLDEQSELYEIFTASYISQLLSHMEGDNVVKLLNYLPDSDSNILLDLLPAEKRYIIEELLAFEPETAGSVMNKSFLVGKVEDTIKVTAERVRGLAQEVEMVYYIYVIDQAGKLNGVVSLRDLILHAQEQTLGEVMMTRLVSVDSSADQEEATKLLQDYDLVALPVINTAGKMLGIITVDDVMDIIVEETTEDFNEFAAISKSKQPVSSEETTWSIARARLPWIIILIFLGMISATLINSFEETLNEVVLLAAFIPIIMDSAGNVGTQSLAVAVRKITIGDNRKGESLGKVVWQEFLVGGILGAAAGMTLSLVVAIFYGNSLLAVIIGVSLWFTLSISTVVGSVIPILINKLKIDPAVASGPFITTINDTFGLMIYFSIATRLLHLL